jgi:membrane associated rhomboid family serine protease
MFIPLYDSNQLRHIKFQYVTIGLIIANVLIYFATQIGLSEESAWRAEIGLSYIPAVVNDLASLPPSSYFIPEDFTYITYAFLHADLFHLGGNMLFLWVFGDNVEDAFGHIKFLIFYLLCAAAGAFLHGLIQPTSEVPLIGASGAIAGIVSAYLILHPRVKLWVLILMRIPLRIPAWIPLVLWVAFQFLMLFIETDNAISWPAHVGGIIAGAVLVLFLRRRGVALFDRNYASAQPEQTIPETPTPITPQTSKWGRPS